MVLYNFSYNFFFRKHRCQCLKDVEAVVPLALRKGEQIEYSQVFFFQENNVKVESCVCTWVYPVRGRGGSCPPRRKKLNGNKMMKLQNNANKTRG